MHFVVYALDNRDTPDARDTHYPAHKAYMAAPTLAILMAGPLLDAQGAKPIGSMIVVEAKSLEEATAFACEDPFCRNGVWGEMTVRPYFKATDNR